MHLKGHSRSARSTTSETPHNRGTERFFGTGGDTGTDGLGEAGAIGIGTREREPSRGTNCTRRGVKSSWRQNMDIHTYHGTTAMCVATRRTCTESACLTINVYGVIVQVVNERDILGTQLIRRNDELALLYEKIRIMQSTLEKGEVQYNNRLKVRPRQRKTHEI